MRESIHSFGSSANLIGVLTQPDDTKELSNSPVVLLLNAGLLNRVGPFRLYVVLARILANKGLSSFRLDLSGIGDSQRHEDNRPRGEQHVADIRETIEFLTESKGARSFVVMGICTGADLAHKSIIENQRIRGAICIDGYSYPTLRYYLNCYLPKFIRRTSWNNLASRVFSGRGVSVDYPDNVGDNDLLSYRWELPPKVKTRADFAELIKRDARMLCIYTAGWPYNYTQQLEDAFRPLKFGRVIRLVFLNNATHTFKVFEDRDILISTILEWLIDPDVIARIYD